MAIFNSYVSLPEGNCLYDPSNEFWIILDLINVASIVTHQIKMHMFGS